MVDARRPASVRTKGGRMVTSSGAGLGERGLSNALERLSEALRSNGVDPRLPFNEALFWGYALQEFHKKRLGNGYHEVCKGSRVGLVTSAVMFARGLVTHELTDVMDVTVIRGAEPGLAIPGRAVPGTSTRGEFRWAALPDDTVDPRGYERVELYRSHVSGKDLLPILEEVESFLLGL